jgi:PEGA domain
MPELEPSMTPARVPAPVFAAVLVALALLQTACAHTMIIETEPPGAKVWVDGELQGEAPVVTEQRTGFGGHVTVRVEAESFETTELQVERTDWFLWPAIIAVTPLFGVPFIVIPFIGPVISIGWAVLTSPTLISLAFIQRYPDSVSIKLRPRSAAGFLQPTDTWLIPDDLDPNPPPLPPKPPEAVPPVVLPPQPDGANPIP